MTIKDHDGLISLGASPTPANNIVIKTPASPDGKLEIYRGVPGGLGAKLFEVDENNSGVRAALNATGDAPIYACRAWVNFNGTTTPPTIRASGNVSSVVRNATGDYTVNFTTAMLDANYCPVIGASPDFGVTVTFGMNWATAAGVEVAPTTTALRFSLGGTATYHNAKYVSVAIFR